MVVSQGTATATPLLNGDFANGLTNWNDASSTGSVEVSSGAAVLTTGDFDDPFSAVLVQGDDGFFNFSDPISLGSDISRLIFDVRFVDLGMDSTEDGGSPFDDALTVALYDSLDFSLDLIFTPGIDRNFGSAWRTVSLDVGPLAGREMALSFELADQDDGRDSRVFIDNVTLTSIPLPGVGLLLLTGLPVLRLFHRSR